MLAKLKVLFDKSDAPVYHAGEKITGVVQIVCTKDLAAKAVGIRLKGNILTVIKKGKHSEELKAKIFDEKLILWGRAIAPLAKCTI